MCFIEPKNIPDYSKSARELLPNDAETKQKTIHDSSEADCLIESNLEYKIPYLAAVGDSDKLKRQDQPSPGQYIYKMSGSKRSRENYFMKVLRKLRNQEE